MDGFNLCDDVGGSGSVERCVSGGGAVGSGLARVNYR